MIRPYTDHTLLWTAFQQGESQAEKQVYQQFFKPLCLFSERITGQLEAAEDIVAESFIKAWGRRQDFTTVDNLKAFLYRVVRNASINFAVAARQHRQAHLQIAYIEGQDKEEGPADQREIPQTVRTQKARAIQLIKTQLLKKNRISSLLLLMAILDSM